MFGKKNISEKISGDEKLGYNTLAKDMSPEEARQYLEQNMNEGIYMQMPHDRLVALHKRMDDGGIKTIFKN